MQKSKTPQKRSRQQRRILETHKKLLNAARKVFSEKGLDMTRIDQITERADLGKGTFYNHFRNKEDLIKELIHEVLGELTAAIEEKCGGISDLPSLLEAIIGNHIEFFCNRWEDFVLYYQGRTDLTLMEGYSGIESPFIEYLERIEHLLGSVLKYRLSQNTMRRIACAVAGFVSGYYSFAVIASQDDDIDKTFMSLRGAIVSSLVRFIQEAAPDSTTNAHSGEQ
jgi:AcrR family transcriptional regulator